MYKCFLKRIADFLIAISGLLLLSPIFILVIILLSIANHGYPFFVQKRPGKNEKIFKIIKFKSMNDRKDEKGNLLSNEERLTRVGAFVRKTSLDEIPQLINVLKGDMSLVGPRPLRIKYLPLYTEEQRKRHDVRPGITGWAQVNGRSNNTWDEKFALDIWYVNNLSAGVDMKIMLKTIYNVIQKKDTSPNDKQFELPLEDYIKQKQLNDQTQS